MSKIHSPAIILSASLLLAAPGWAQRNPTAEELSKALTPTSGSLQTGETRGVHRLSPSSDAAAPSANQAVRHDTGVASSGAEAPSAALYVQFANGSAELTPRAMATLDELGKALSGSALSSYRFRIEGHTDTVGSKDYNQSLSQRRAQAVVEYIEQKYSIDSHRLVAVGLGSDHLLVPTPDQTPEARNRRVEVVNAGT